MIFCSFLHFIMFKNLAKSQSRKVKKSNKKLCDSATLREMFFSKPNNIKAKQKKELFFNTPSKMNLHHLYGLKKISHNTIMIHPLHSVND
jgi:hypothetical protein